LNPLPFCWNSHPRIRFYLRPDRGTNVPKREYRVIRCRGLL